MAPIDAVIFDLDGVLTDTAELHYQAWKQLADEEGLPFDRTRNEALRGVSRRRSLEILLGDREVSSEAFEEMLERKNRYYRERIQHLTPADRLPGVTELLAELRRSAVGVAVASASRNARAVLERLELLDEVDLVLDGHAPARSKPAPDLFLLAADRLGVPPERCLVVEDAAAGVDAALNAGMWVLGIGPAERVGHAHLVRPGLDGVTLGWLQERLKALKARRALWQVTEERLEPARLPAQETVFTVGNGYVGTRGTFEEGWPGRDPVTLVAGLWDAAPVVHTELVNAPDWTALEVWVDEEPLRLDRGELLAYRRWLDLREGRLVRRILWRSPEGTEVEVLWERFAALPDPHRLAQRLRIRPLNRPARIRIRAGLHGHVHNAGQVHWEGDGEGTGWIRLRTRTSGRILAAAGQVLPWGRPPVDRYGCVLPGSWGETLVFELAAGEAAGLDRLVTLYTDREADDPLEAAVEELAHALEEGYDRLLARHRAAWRDLWEAADVEIEGDPESQRAVRFALYHLLIAAPRHTDRVSLGAKTLSGLGYRGHVFWDTEIFMLPFFAFTLPDVARNLLMYRVHTLPAARENARRGGHAGARYAWESAETGREVTPPWGIGPGGKPVRIWCGEIELHITADVAYALWQYWQVSGDDPFMEAHGARILLETARFWESRVEPEADGYHIRDVIGPDEYHEHVDDNAYTNALVAWHLERAAEIWGWLRNRAPEQAAELATELELSEERIARWLEIARDLVFLEDPETGRIEQFAGYFGLEDVDLKALEPRTRSVPDVLGLERVQRTQVLKQPDVLMLLYLLPDRFPRRALEANWAYYVPRTDHSYGSSLGPAIHAALAARLGRVEEAYAFFRQAALMDLEDLRGNTADGIHGAACGGVWQAVVFGFAGLKVTPEGWTVDPHLPPEWTRLRFRFVHRGRLQTVEVTADREKGGAADRQTPSVSSTPTGKTP